ncbi:CdaR family transcriptional regulator [Conexibacter sp. SYSU D00693]|uniref:PucR family transcriptional regulator n=1 Tax=Conexibacter sp. SYSU D00693 TaxID=2812560 RepID=UPI00196A7869|nr:helix-turn-helix domain-containing protein [Conexibacter sp. SYSU D00693]
MRSSPAGSRPRSEAAAEALRRAARAIEQRADEIAQRVADDAQGEVRELPDDPQTHEELRSGARMHLLDFLRTLQRGEPLEAIRPAPEAIAAARGLARSGRSLEPVLRACHFGHHAFLDAWNRELAAQPLPAEVLAETLRSAQELTFRWLDVLVRRLSDEHEQAQAAAVGSAQATRVATVRAILEGDATDADAVSRAIGYELRRTHLGLVVWSRAPSSRPRALAELNDLADAIAASVDAPKALKVPVGGGLLWAWAASDGPLDVERVSDAVGRRRPESVSVAVGEPQPGLDGFRDSHREASEAARVALLAAGRVGAVVRYRDVELISLVSGDLERARRFVGRQLGPLAGGTQEHARLRDTLRAYLEEHGSRSAAAHRLAVHPNTVSNRVAACTELLGRDVLRAGSDLALALRLADVLGSAVLEPGA